MGLKFKEREKHAKIQTMTPEVKVKFIEYLKSGRFKQGTARFRNVITPRNICYCVMGVLEQVAADDPASAIDNSQLRWELYSELADYAGLDRITVEEGWTTLNAVANYEHVRQILHFTPKQDKLFFGYSFKCKVGDQLIRGMDLIRLNDHKESGCTFAKFAEIVEACF